MDVFEAVASRRSIRKFTPEPVSRSLLREIIEAATRAPSAKNAQPWEFIIVDGKPLEDLKKANVEALTAGDFAQSEVLQVPFQGIYRERQVDLAVRLFQAMGIEREDEAKRNDWQERGFRFFDAPAAIFLAIDKSIDSDMTFLDVGAVMQSICLVATGSGLGTCIEDQGAMFPEVVRKHTGVPASKRIVICVAIGYPDPEFPANKLKTPREPVDNVITWVNGGQNAWCSSGVTRHKLEASGVGPQRLK